MNKTKPIEKNILYTATNEVTEVCKPLFDAVNINFFDYSRIYPDGSRAWLATDRGLIDCYFKNKYELQNPAVSGTEVRLWANYPNKKSAKDKYALNIHNGIAFFIKKDNYLEGFDFASDVKDSSVTEFYFNNLDLLHKFFCYFKDKAADLIKKAENDRIIIPKEMLPKPQKQVLTYEEFLNCIKTKKVKLDFNSQEIEFSRREYECLALLAKGKTMKEVGRELEISHKTVDIHLTHAREKAGSPTTSKLIELFWMKLSNY